MWVTNEGESRMHVCRWTLRIRQDGGDTWQCSMLADDGREHSLASDDLDDLKERAITYANTHYAGHIPPPERKWWKFRRRS